MVILSLSINLKELRSRLGLFSYYQQYIKRFSDIIRFIYESIREENGKPVLFEWMLAKQKTFEIIKVKLVTASMMIYSDFDRPFILYTDALSRSIGAILHQKSDDRKKQIIAYTSRTFNEYEKKYSITEQKCLVVV